MDSGRATKLIDFAGGTTEFAKLLGLEIKDGVHQRINNWKKRGIPSDVVLAHYNTIKKLDAAANGEHP